MCSVCLHEDSSCFSDLRSLGKLLTGVNNLALKHADIVPLIGADESWRTKMQKFF